MNKELYLKNKELNNKSNQLFDLINSLKKFLDNNESKFKNKESIIALKTIKDYLITKEKELDIVQNNYKNSYVELINTCNHESAIKNINQYYCLICNRSLGKTVPKESIISIDAKSDYLIHYMIIKILDNLIINDKDIIEPLTEELIKIQDEKDIKVYRR